MTTDPIPQILAITGAAQRAFLSGDAMPYIELFEHSEDITSNGPFGGEPLKGWTVIEPRLAKAAILFDGVASSEIEVASSFTSSDLVVLVMIEKNQVRIKERDGVFPWNLRVTQVYRHTENGWRVVHRHSEPLGPRRSVDQNLDLMALA